MRGLRRIGPEWGTWNADHIKPLSKRWDLRVGPRNLQTTCASCNWWKGGR
ncbi:MAG: HNH endonuclease [Bryobacterales bacterium]|nr:HNH endonuclease [Bryobacterales bacterium]